jgi:hypothetical protein
MFTNMRILKPERFYISVKDPTKELGYAEATTGIQNIQNT